MLKAVHALQGPESRKEELGVNTSARHLAHSCSVPDVLQISLPLIGK